MSRERNFQRAAMSFAATGGAGAARAVEQPRQERPGRISLGEARRRARESAERADEQRREYVERDARQWADYKTDE